jgi:hypothetical protein
MRLCEIRYSHLRPAWANFQIGKGRTMRGLSLVLVAAMLGGMAPVAMSAQTAPDSSKAMKAMTPATMPTDAEIADAKAKGMVWANMNTKVYHKDDAQYGRPSTVSL